MTDTEKPASDEPLHTDVFRRGTLVEFYKLDANDRETLTYAGSLLDDFRMGEHPIFTPTFPPGGKDGHLSRLRTPPIFVDGRWIIETKNSRYVVKLGKAPEPQKTKPLPTAGSAVDSKARAKAKQALAQPAAPAEATGGKESDFFDFIVQPDGQP